ncbi:MAG: hypothetical protein DHS80DRAFT_16002, partial [Piptocephalis tieghemiana]
PPPPSMADHTVLDDKEASLFVDPCEKARQRSMACLEYYNMDRGPCEDVFIEYKKCKASWMDARREARRQGTLGKGGSGGGERPTGPPGRPCPS